MDTNKDFQLPTLISQSDKDDILVKLFFDEMATPIADKGFTRKVLLHLPGTIYKISIVLETIGSMAALYMITYIIDFSKLNELSRFFSNLNFFAHI